ncbi:hypothetical protein J4470_05040 [Candidatus Woesearchaeota archaeon]|nr:hypothetical protein [Candidatus Woesearchaeota archaeon]
MKEKKRFDVKIAVIALVLIAILILYLAEYPAEETAELSELQTVACEVADEAGTCDSRLPDLGIVLQEECCQALGKCCGDEN